MFSFEEQWLLALCPPCHRSDSPYDIDALRGPVPTPRALSALAAREKLLPLLSWHLQRAEGRLPALQGFPNELRAELRHAHKQQRKLSMGREHLLHRLDGWCEKYGFSCLLYKGCAYEVALYPEAGLRPMTDVDLLLPGAEYREFLALLSTKGFEQIQSAPNEICLQDGKTGIYIDVHRDVSAVHEGQIELNALFSRATVWDGGRALLLLPLPEALLLHVQHMRSHGMEPGYVSLLHFSELALLWSKLRDEEHRRLIELAERWHLLHLLALGVICLEAMPLAKPFAAVPSLASLSTHDGIAARAQQALWRLLLQRIRRQEPVVNVGPIDGKEHALRRRALRSLLRIASHDGWRDLARSQRRALWHVLRRS